MKNIRCLTNNPMVIDRGLSFVEALPGISVVELFMAVQKQILSGYRLITHPLTGSMDPYKNPYKSIVLTGVPGKVDPRSREVMERAIAFAEGFTEKQMKLNWDSSTLRDFQLIDLDFIKEFLK
ncbi:MAG TPA: hypothetical protein GXX59_07270 [Syntrophomonadaceae bacterium]|nr:hypothetical protein [Syntrophomonadaceae bacterium]